MSGDRRGIEPAVVLARWLLDGPARIGSGAEVGAVAGCVDGDGRPRYAYPEITGYFLQWLAWRVACGDDVAPLSPLAASAQHWLRRWCATEGTPARVYLDAPEPDWRNGALFCFDLAMVFRGLAAAGRAGLLEPDPALVASLASLAEKLIEPDGAFAACVPLEPGIELPERWSTRRGGFLAKAAAGILDAAEVPGMPARLVAAAEASFGASVEVLVTAPHVEVHPLLYGFEGVVIRSDDPRSAAVLPALAARFDALLEVVDALGGVPESLSGGNPVPNLARSDVLAQTLRVGVLLARLRPGYRPALAVLARLRDVLVSRIKPNGALPFGADPGAAHALDNVWATVFAEQALVLTAPGMAASLPRNAGSLLV